MVGARPGLVTNMRTMAPIIDSGARVPMRSVTWVSRCTALASLVSRTMSLPVEKRSRLP